MAQPLSQVLRTGHRWTSTVAMALLTWVAVSGVALALDVLFQPRFPPPPPLPPLLADAALPRLARAGLAAAYADAPDVRPAQVEVALSMRRDQVLAEVRWVPASQEAASRATTFVLDPISGRAAVAPLGPPRSGLSDYLKFRIALHQLLEKLHRGNIIGWSGQCLSVLTGLSFVFLTVSGAWMYFDQLGRRRRIGKRQMFWN